MQVEKLLFDGFDVIGRTVLIGIMAYIALIIILRIGGKRTLSKMNAYDMVVTVALGSTLSGIMTSKDITIAQGVTAFLTLVVLQYIFTKLSLKSEKFSSLIKSKPTLLFYNSEFMHDAMKRERILEIEVLQAIRSNSGSSIENVNAVILESDGSLSVLTGDKRLTKDDAVLRNLERHAE
ncbi:DUF421 domain-containing protein [Macrococcus carouselicus]|uniref:DUF421 domain-containing protein n=1 Tax=Macrococcus carouselicus TaxID=69969 RepID=A0A9Q8FP38_9STAP|nr:YetF domain-containing protein [Macrococcus carouselicus]TDL96626.1 DUF421 domain-containing protein [Macrococcus carouselicus]